MANPQKPLSADDRPFAATGKPNPLPEGKVFKADPNTWYNLKVQFTDETGSPAVGYFAKIGDNPSTSFWDYICLGAGAGCKFKVHQPDAIGWSNWEIDDGNWLSVKATGWVYRSSAYAIGWQIVGNNLYNSYWSGIVGYEHRRILVSEAYYVGMDLPPFTCELVPAGD